MKERWAVALLGVSLMGSLMMFVVAPTNFRLIDELLRDSSNTRFRALVERAAALLHASCSGTCPQSSIAISF